jgi:hypothetical protein
VLAERVSAEHVPNVLTVVERFIAQIFLQIAVISPAKTPRRPTAKH